ncbi:MAG TPA: glycosyltransferase family 2 protein [Flavobacteriaceae bacterium]|nr:glycosyltransferase family 2 protein [Flavobacteriaceae bacterium]HPF12427.1 glycosyltransferase family 2 protein [Flavobacteriaceae bacterium]HQU21610.1 glycosyltransferase family 2 protein [Flavobacteriaceae bacterium]HQU66139.1 glycosyltransferase family 2 protein [Flavobacteriaceae bacterium]
MTHRSQIGIVIPYYNAQKHIINVVTKASKYCNYIVIVDDDSPDELPVNSLQAFTQVHVLKNPENLGVGGATLAGIKYLEQIPEVAVIIKLDADDQMDTSYIPLLVEPLISYKADFSKGNRFRDFRALKQMPWLRRFGNLFLSFLSKMATGYWNCFDFNNGYFAITKKMSLQLDKLKISHNYFFETSLISELYFQKAFIKEIPMPALYGDESSNMKLFKMPFLFSVNLLKKFIARIWKSYFVYDFNIGTIYLVFGLLLFLSGVVFGAFNWYSYASKNALTPLGTIMISALLVILGFQLILQAIQFDILQTPKKLSDD